MESLVVDSSRERAAIVVIIEEVKYMGLRRLRVL